MFFNLSRTFSDIIKAGAQSRMSDLEILATEIINWKSSPERKMMIEGEAYYRGDQKILEKLRQAIGADGQLITIDNLPNNRWIDNQYAKMVDQKVNYLLGRPVTFKSENEQYADAVKSILNKAFHRRLKTIGENSLNGGIGWLYPYYNETGAFAFKIFKPYEIKPFWADAEHTVLEGFIRLYLVEVYEGKKSKNVEKVDVVDSAGIRHFVLSNNSLVPDNDIPDTAHFMIDGQGYSWEKIPLIAWKYNNIELPLIKRTKCLQDAINQIFSTFGDNMQEDSRNTILVLTNYDGTNLGEFRQNLAMYGAVKVRSTNDGKGGVDSLTIEVDAENYKTILALLRKALIENARGFDGKDERLSGTPNQMNILSMYSEIDLDANGMETEFQASFEELLWFVNAHLSNAGLGNYDGQQIEVIFDRDMLMNESEIITNCKNSVGLISNETILSNHPWVTDPSAELERLKKEKEESMLDYQNAFDTGSGVMDNATRGVLD